MDRYEYLLKKYVTNADGKIFDFSELVELNNGNRKLRRYLGPTNFERFLNYVVHNGFLLHGSTEQIDSNEEIKPLYKQKICATDFGAIALMYSVHTNKNEKIFDIYEDIGSVTTNRNWFMERTSDQLVIYLQYDLSYIDPNKDNVIKKSKEMQNTLLDLLLSESIKKQGYIYVLDKKSFVQNKELPCEFKSKNAAKYKSGFKVPCRLYKGEVEGILLISGEKVYSKKISEKYLPN